MLLHHLLTELGTIIVPAAVTIPKFLHVLSETGECLNQDLHGKADRLINQLDWYTHALKNHKQLTARGPCKRRALVG